MRAKKWYTNFREKNTPRTKHSHYSNVHTRASDLSREVCSMRGIDVHDGLTVPQKIERRKSRKDHTRLLALLFCPTYRGISLFPQYGQSSDIMRLNIAENVEG